MKFYITVFALVIFPCLSFGQVNEDYARSLQDAAYMSRLDALVSNSHAKAANENANNYLDMTEQAFKNTQMTEEDTQTVQLCISDANAAWESGFYKLQNATLLFNGGEYFLGAGDSKLTEGDTLKAQGDTSGAEECYSLAVSYYQAACPRFYNSDRDAAISDNYSQSAISRLNDAWNTLGLYP